jgi:hypothetical protein
VARGGRPVAAIDWWGTYPAEPLPGLVVAHGAWGQLAAGDEHAVAPPGRRAELVEQRERLLGEPLAPEAAPAAVAERALEPDRFYREVARLAGGEARAIALYLPAADLAAALDDAGGDALAELVRRELIEADRLIGELVPGFGAVAVVLEPGRRGGREGRALIWNGRCAAAARPRLAPAQVAAALLRAAGLPRSLELPEPPAFCEWPAAAASVASYGERADAGAPAERGDDYLETLRSLGYL